MQLRWLVVPALAALVAAPEAAWAAEATPFERVHCLRYAFGRDVPVATLAPGAPAEERMELPFVICVARRPGTTVVLDAGYVDTDYAAQWGVRPEDWSDLPELLAQIGVAPADVSHVTLSHLHWDHAGGTSRFPNARFVIQERELLTAVSAMPDNAFASVGFRAEEIVAAVELKWQRRLDVVSGDVEGYLPGLDLYLTPGHTAGTMTVCLATRKGRVCYTSDAVYLYRNLEENLPLGIAYSPPESFESYARIRDLLRGGLLVPGHEPALFSDPEAHGFRRVSRDVVAIVE